MRQSNLLSFASAHVTMSEMLDIIGAALARNVTWLDQAPSEPTISVSRQMTVDDALGVLQTTLASAGYTMSFDNANIYVKKGSPSESVRLNHPLIRAVRLNYIDSTTFLSLAGRLIPAERLVTSSTDPSLIIYIGPASGTGTLKDLQSLLDVYDLRNSAATLIPVKSGDPAEIATNISRSLGISASGFPRILPLRRNKALLVIAPRGFDLADIYRLVSGLDRLTPDDANPIRSISPRERPAEEILALLRHIVDQGGAAGAVTNAASSAPGTDPQPVGSTGENDQSGLRGEIGLNDTPPVTLGSDPGLVSKLLGQSGGSSDDLAGLRRLIAATTVDRSTNRILFSGTAAEFAILKRAVNSLDQSGGQILIEAVVLQIALTDQLQFGVQYALNNAHIMGTPVSGSLSSSGGSTDGLILQLGSGGFDAVIHALDNVTNVTVISSPKILVASGDTAQFNFGASVPILKSVLTTSAGQGAAIANQIDYHDTGVSLVVTAAEINQSIADLKLKQSLSDLSKTAVSGVSSPVFDQREVETHVRMRFGDTLMLGGIIEHQRSDSDSGMPGLNRIPILGALFGSRDRSGARSEFVLLLRPRLYSVNSGGPQMEDATALRFDRLQQAWDRLHVGNAFPTAATKRAKPLLRP